MLHEHRPPTIELHQIRADQESVIVAYRAPERGCFPVLGVALLAISQVPANPGKVLAIHLNEGEGEFHLTRSTSDPEILAVLAFDDSPERVTSLPSVEPMVGDLPRDLAAAIQTYVQAHLVRVVTPERNRHRRGGVRGATAARSRRRISDRVHRGPVFFHSAPPGNEPAMSEVATPTTPATDAAREAQLRSRGLYAYNDGFRPRLADVIAVQMRIQDRLPRGDMSELDRLLATASGDEDGAKAVQSPVFDQAEAILNVPTAMVRLAELVGAGFDLPPLDEETAQGLSIQERVDLLSHFLATAPADDGTEAEDPEDDQPEVAPEVDTPTEPATVSDDTNAT